MKQPTILIIVGITGDLAKRKLLPAIENISKANELSPDFRIVGITRQETSVEQVLAGVKEGTDLRFLREHLELFRMDLEEQADYTKMADRLTAIETMFGRKAQRLFYLSVPPQISRPIIEHLGKAGMAKIPDTKLLLEKPFGSDLQSATELVTRIKAHFDETQIYRIDHYVAKEMAQNLLVFRSENSLFKRTWNADFIERIEIIASEKIGIEGRTTFYEQTGALRDFTQSHLLQLAALTLMELPSRQNLSAVPKQRLAALRALRPPETTDVLRGQYVGYRDEVANPHSTVETFVSMTLHSEDARWRGVPIAITAGKNLAAKFTEIRIHYRQDDAEEANQLTLRLQPEEGIEVDLWSKRPGYTRELEQVRLNFAYHETATNLPEAYEQVLLDAIRTDHTLFISSEEVLASWELLAKTQANWADSDKDLFFYEPGTAAQVIAYSP